MNRHSSGPCRPLDSLSPEAQNPCVRVKRWLSRSPNKETRIRPCAIVSQTGGASSPSSGGRSAGHEPPPVPSGSPPVTELIIESVGSLQAIAGVNDKNLRRIEKRFDVQLLVRGDELRIRGEDAALTQQAESLLRQLFELVDLGRAFDEAALKFIIHAFADDPSIRIREVFSEEVRIVTGKREIAPRSLIQREYMFAMQRFDVTLAIGPAGTGKTYLAMAAGVEALLKKRVSRIVLTRPVVEAGESLGFLPGTLEEKIDPYLRPLHDALFDMLDAEKVARLLEQRLIEIAPLAYMRGRTFNDSFLILDEAQNATREQMKMFLTRLGLNSKVVITGDITQIDLPPRQVSGLVHVREVLQGTQGIRFIEFTDRDVVRHELVRRIVQAYEAHARQLELLAPDGGATTP
ncbi:MAG: PhoH family protein [Nitrospinae bacterium]|nr:PhoH family protein [Nitrospinota bacterium]